jgi:Xaa-Pro dipeptidase
MFDEVLQERHLATLAARTADALGTSGFDRLVIHSGLERLAFLDDQAFPFRANPHFLWWVPLTDAPRCLLQVEPGAKPLLLFHAPQDYWHAPPVLPDAHWTRLFDIRPVRDWAATCQALPRPDARTAFIGEPFAGLEDLGFESINPPALLRRLHEHRVRKTPYELSCLRAASRLGARGHVAARAAFSAGESEYAIHQAFITACGLREQELPYAAIIAHGTHAATLHYQRLEREPPAAPGSLLIDAGAACRGYASDITRTYAGQDGEFAALVAGMEDLQQSLCAAVRTGMDWRDLHLTAHRLVAELLRDAGVLRIDPETAVDTGVSGVFLPHGLGHLLGLQVHDVAGFHPDPDAPPVPPPAGHEALRLTRVLETGFVVTMEPGLYFIDHLLAQAQAGAHAGAIDWAAVERLRPYGGIRIEDDLVVTESGHENLTRLAFAAETGAQGAP